MTRPNTAASLQRWLRCLGAAFCVLFVMVWEHVEALGLDRQVVSLQKEADRLTYENGQLQMQIHHWLAPGRLESVARKDFNMVPLDASHIIDIQKK